MSSATVEVEGAGGTRAEVPPADVTVPGQWLLSTLRLQGIYDRLLVQNYLIVIPDAEQTVARHHSDGGGILQDRVRQAVTNIGTRQVWREVWREQAVLDRFFAAVLALLVVASLLGAATSGLSLGLAVAFFFTSLVGLVAFGVLAGLTYDFLTGHGWRAALVVSIGLALLVLGAGGVLLYGQEGYWTKAGSFVAMVAAVLVVTMVVVVQVALLSTKLVFRYTWRSFTEDDIIQTLATLSWGLRQPEVSWSWVADDLWHVGEMIETHLPRSLAFSSGLQLAAAKTTADMAASFKALSLTALTGPSADRAHVQEKVDKALLLAVQGRWGDLDRAAIDPEPGGASWRRGWADVRRVLVALLPLAAMIGALVYVLHADPNSALVKPEFFAPLLVAGLGLLAPLLTGPRPADANRPGGGGAENPGTVRDVGRRLRPNSTP